MKKQLVTLGLTLGLLSVGGTAALAGANSPMESKMATNDNRVSGYVEGRHAYGTWSVSGAYASLVENCGSGDREVAYLSGSSSNDYYMDGACKYKVAIKSVENSSGSARVSNFK